MVATPGVPSHAAMEQAANWFARLQAGDMSTIEHARWQAWLDSSADARTAWALVEHISQQFGQQFQSLQAAGSGALAAQAYQVARHRMSRRRVLRDMAGLAGAGALGWGLWRHTPLPAQLAAWTADHRTATGEAREMALADGTSLWLNTGSAVDLHYSSTLRRVQLRAGEILMETAADPRPLVVDTAYGRLQALGTRFTTRLDGADALLAVYEGAVRVWPRSAQFAVTVSAGQQVRFDAHAVGAKAAADPAREAWRRGILLANGIPLSHWVAELQRYRRDHLSLAPELADLRVLGSYPTHDTDAALAMLQAVLPVDIHHRLPWWTSITPIASA